jgi:hypothetical protein
MGGPHASSSVGARQRNTTEWPSSYIADADERTGQFGAAVRDPTGQPFAGNPGRQRQPIFGPLLTATAATNVNAANNFLAQLGTPFDSDRTIYASIMSSAPTIAFWPVTDTVATSQRVGPPSFVRPCMDYTYRQLAAAHTHLSGPVERDPLLASSRLRRQ